MFWFNFLHQHTPLEPCLSERFCISFLHWHHGTLQIGFYAFFPFKSVSGHYALIIMMLMIMICSTH